MKSGSTSGTPEGNYAFERDESVDAAMRRVLSEQFARIIGQLSSFPEHPDSSAHDGRRRIKETRALLRLFRDRFDGRYGEANVLLRDSARSLAAVRDADAMKQTLSRNRSLIVEKNGRLVHESARRALRRSLRARKATEGLSPDDLDAMISRLQLSLASLLTTPPVDDSFAAFAKGLRRTYRNGKRAMKSAGELRTAESFHEWRKSVKTLWYHTQLLRNVAPELLKPYRDLLNQLAKALGEHHDVHVLESFIASRRSRRREGVQEVLLQRLAEIEQRALALGEQLYADSTGAFVDRLEQLWNSSRR